MARSLTEIYNAIILEKENMTELLALQPAMDSSQNLLQDLTSTSRVAIWRLIFWVVAVAIFIHEKLWDVYLIELEDLAKKLIPGTQAWLVREAKLYQHGDTITLVNGYYSYADINMALQIIKYCSIAESNGVVVKVAKETDNKPVKLSDTELQGVSNYLINYRRFAGVQMQVVSRDADKVRIYGQIYYSASVSVATVKANVATAINSYLSRIQFNSIFSITRITDAIQEAVGVTDVVITRVSVQPEGSTWADVSRIHTPWAGYMALDSEISLDDTLSYAV